MERSELELKKRLTMMARCIGTYENDSDFGCHFEICQAEALDNTNIGELSGWKKEPAVGRDGKRIYTMFTPA